MQYRVFFQYKHPNSPRPDQGAEFTLDCQDGNLMDLPDVGDSVSYQLEDEEKRVIRKVLTKHFSFHQPQRDECFVYISVTDLPSDEYQERVKE